jgi:ABC-type glycerol-3-phosphate transport system substrate-binding protein
MESKKHSRREFLRTAALGAAGAFLAACQPRTVIVKETVEVEKEKIVTQVVEVEKEVTKIVAGTPVVQKVVETQVVEKVVTAPPPTAEPVEISFMNFWSGTRVPLMDEVIARFQEEFPHITVENAITPGDNQVQARATALASSSPPSLIMCPRDEMLKFASEELIIPIDSYIEARGIDVYEVFYQSEADNCKYDGRFYSYPLPTGGGSTNIWYYNKNVMRDAGLDPDNPPETWQDVTEIVDATTIIEEGNVQRSGVITTYFNFGAWIYCNDGQYYSDDGQQLTINQPQAVETLEWMDMLMNEELGGIEAQRAFFEGVGYKNADWPFYTDTACLWPGAVQHFFGFWSLYPDMAMDKEHWGVTFVPYNGNNPNAKATGTSGLTLAWNQVIPKNLPQKVQDAAYEFLEFFTTRRAGGCWFVLQQGRPSPARVCNQNPEYFDKHPYWDVVLDAMEIDVHVPVPPVHSEIESVIAEAVDQVYYRTKTPEEALDWAYDTAQPILDEFLEKS